VRYCKTGSQPEQDVTVTATIKVAAFIFSSHKAAGVVKLSIAWNTLQPLEDSNYFYMHLKRKKLKSTCYSFM
jgi:hypothetical protein